VDGLHPSLHCFIQHLFNHGQMQSVPSLLYPTFI
jgi:hypothetical protein